MAQTKLASADTLVKRIPLHRGPFYFGPQFLGSAEVWTQHFQTTLTELFRRHEISASFDTEIGFVLEASVGDLKFAVDALSGKFVLQSPPNFTADGHEYECDLFLCDVPDAFVRGLDLPPTRPFANQVATLAPVVETLHQWMEEAFTKAVDAGEARIEGRPFSAHASWKHLDADQVKRRTVYKTKERDGWVYEEDNDLDDVTIAGAPFFSLCIVTPVAAPAARPAPVATKAVDGRARKDKSKIVRIIEEEHARGKLHANWNATQLTGTVVSRLDGMKTPPAANTIRRWIEELEIF